MSKEYKRVRVGDIRKAILDLPDHATVLVQAERPWSDTGPDSYWSDNTRELSICFGTHDGRYGRCLMMELGQFSAPFDSKARLYYDEEDREDEQHTAAE